MTEKRLTRTQDAYAFIQAMRKRGRRTHDSAIGNSELLSEAGHRSRSGVRAASTRLAKSAVKALRGETRSTKKVNDVVIDLAVDGTADNGTGHLTETTAHMEAGGPGFSALYSSDSISVNRRPL